VPPWVLAVHSDRLDPEIPSLLLDPEILSHRLVLRGPEDPWRREVRPVP